MGEIQGAEIPGTPALHKRFLMEIGIVMESRQGAATFAKAKFIIFYSDYRKIQMEQAGSAL